MSNLPDRRDDELTKTVRVSDDGTREIVVTRWLDRQHVPPRWRSKNYTRKLTRKLNAGEREYLAWLEAERKRRPS